MSVLETVVASEMETPVAPKWDSLTRSCFICCQWRPSVNCRLGRQKVELDASDERWREIYGWWGGKTVKLSATTALFSTLVGAASVLSSRGLVTWLGLVLHGLIGVERDVRLCLFYFFFWCLFYLMENSWQHNREDGSNCKLVKEEMQKAWWLIEFLNMIVWLQRKKNN